MLGVVFFATAAMAYDASGSSEGSGTVTQDCEGNCSGKTATKGKHASPLYLLTYDHGGIVLWGEDHFLRYLRKRHVVPQAHDIGQISGPVSPAQPQEKGSRVARGSCTVRTAMQVFLN